MRRKITTTAAATALALAGFAAVPSPPAGPLASPLLALSRAQAAATKSLAPSGGEGGNVAGAGDRLGHFISGNAVPVLLAIAGCLLIGVLVTRNIGAAVGIVLVTLVGLIFFLSPTSIESAAKAIAGIVF